MHPVPLPISLVIVRMDIVFRVCVYQTHPPMQSDRALQITAIYCYRALLNLAKLTYIKYKDQIHGVLLKIEHTVFC